MQRISRILLVGGSGYIGSYLQNKLTADGYAFDVCDLGWRGHVLGPVLFACDYAALANETVAGYSHILWFAGHSSVGAAVADPHGALMNNCINLVALRARMAPGARLIYASSASLYSSPPSSRPHDPPLARENDRIVAGTNAYDMSKFCFDYMAQGFLKNFIGLRLGTVCGYSPNLRPELIFNAMNIAAIEEGRVRVGNREAYRSIVFLDDLYDVVDACMNRGGLADGFVNVASATATIGEIAIAVARAYCVAIEELPRSRTYSFRLSTDKAVRELGVSFDGDLEHRCRQFRREYERTA
jgi:UDP-glucose 4-epimerase